MFTTWLEQGNTHHLHLLSLPSHVLLILCPLDAHLFTILFAIVAEER